MLVQSMPKSARKLRRLLAGCGLDVLGLPAVSNAAVIQTTLDTLMPGGSNAGTGLVIGDKRYTNFSFASTGSAPLRASDVNVRIDNDADPTSTDPARRNGQRYTLQFTFGLDAFPSERTDLVVGYDLDVTSADFINRVGLKFNGSVPSQGVGDAAASVVETISTRDGSDLSPGAPVRDTEVLDVFNDGPGRLEDSNSDFMAVNLTRRLHFVKDIIVSSRPTGGYAAISVVDNIVDQIPEPGMISLVTIAGGAVLLRRRRA